MRDFNVMLVPDDDSKGYILEVDLGMFCVVCVGRRGVGWLGELRVRGFERVDCECVRAGVCVFFYYFKHFYSY